LTVLRSALFPPLRSALRSPLAPRKGGGVDFLARWIDASVYADYDARRLDLMFQESTEVTPVDASGQKVGSWNSVVGGYTAKNATPSQRLNLSIASGRNTLTGDGADDSLLTTFFAASGGNTIFVDLDVPASLAALMCVFGSQESSAKRYNVIIGTSGKLGFGLGSLDGAVQAGTNDWRGERLVGAVTHDGSTVKIYSLVDGVATEEFSGAQGDVPTTIRAARVSALNNNDAAIAIPSSVGVARIVAVRKGGLTLADWENIGPQFAAAGA